ncbi:hypothetical protein DOTSEDRAFT_85203 [Dothistroma septosporum NZE10]|uniref:CNNM transmembrane domain-containing protein n=1 Tax=Dothistroma septosporum (strain NZE10 / CBS 128990) TaxID=675120 RepID=N1Q4V3_DOTSN|nr:hypothetical protein DOTSEDRAFT_85203 [Dothistroma septosporum NZE10]
MSVSAGLHLQRHHLQRYATPSARSLQHHGFAALRPAVLVAARLLLLPLASAAPILHTLADEDLSKDADDPSLWIYLGVAVALVLLGGVFAGLTIALMGQDETYLQVIATSGEGAEKKHAARVLRLLGKGKHWVLVTLLLSNVITNETLPIVLDRSLGGGWPAVVSSTVLIVIFGEVAPQSVCVRYGLSIGAYCAPLVLGLMWLMSPVAWPTAKLLDWILGEDHGTMYKKAGLKTLVSLHKQQALTQRDGLMDDEVTIINSVLDLKEKAVGDIMTPMQDVFTMSADTVLDERMMDTILSQGYSRIPIYAPDNPRNFVGMLLVKILITYDPEDAKRVRDFALATLPETAPRTSCLDIINFFQEGKSHMVLVSDFPGQDKGAVGVVTLEDVIEELIGEEIIDESDVFVDVHKAIRRMAPAPKTRFGKKQFAAERDQALSENEDDGKEATENEPLLKTDAKDSKRPSLANGQTTFLMRRKSSAASDSAREAGKAVPVRSNATDVMEHLKHLGPSNAAAHPRTTKYSSVKIKPGVGTIPENKATTTGAEVLSPKQQPSPIAEASESAEVDSLRGKSSSGGAAAVYGTMDSPTQQRARGMSATETMSAQEASRIAAENTASRPEDDHANDADNEQDQYRQHEPEPLQIPDKLIVGEGAEDDEVGELPDSPALDRSKKRLATRSGSITETTVDVGGMKKTVLEMTSSSEEGNTGNEGSTNGDNDVAHGKDFPNGDGAGTGDGGKKKQRKKRGKKKKSDREF